MTIATTAKIYPWAKIIHTGANLSVGEHSQIDDFAFVNAGNIRLTVAPVSPSSCCAL